MGVIELRVSLLSWKPIGLNYPDRLLEKDIGRRRITNEEASLIRGRLQTTTQIDALSEVDFVIEAVPVRSYILARGAA